MKTKAWILLPVLCTLLQGCAFMFNEAFLHNHCRKCEVIDPVNDSVLWTVEGCGGQNTNLEPNAEAEAYKLIRSSGNCEIYVTCRTWKKEVERE